MDAPSSLAAFEESLKHLQSGDQTGEQEAALTLFPGGVLLDQHYAIPPRDLNLLFFDPASSFVASLVDLQGTTEYTEGPWELHGGTLKRTLNYVKPAKFFIKFVKMAEEQTYIKADEQSYAVVKRLTAPDAPYGNSIRTEILVYITAGPETPSGEATSRLVVSWRMIFLQRMLMKGMLEGAARQGLKEDIEKFAELLAQTVKPVDAEELSRGGGSDRERALAGLVREEETDWRLAWRFLGNFTVASAFANVVLVTAHVALAGKRSKEGLEFDCLDLPDSAGEVLFSVVLVAQAWFALQMVSRFLRARTQRDGDHGTKAEGEGWVLTVALIEGTKLAALDSTGFSDPYVVFTCGGKSKTSSIKFQTLNPQWNEVLEFDAMDDPPSVMNIEVYDSDGQFDESICLGRAKINFLKSKMEDLADVWIPLKGKLAQCHQSKLHLWVFLSNTKGTEVAKEYFSKMEKEIGKKINLRSPQSNTAFQKLFGLPMEEFLINDFACQLKRKMPLQGRLFLSSRIIGFNANLFGQRTKFFFLWEDIEDIQVVAPSLTSVGSPSLMIILRKGRGMDAKHGAKTQHGEGRLRFHFQAFVPFEAAHKTIIALWKSRSLTAEPIAEEQSDTKSTHTKENECSSDVEDVIMKKVYSSLHPVQADLLMELFGGGHMERKVMEKVGCVNSSHTAWKLVKPDIHQRRLSYKFDKHISSLEGEVNSTQQISFLAYRKAWTIEEVMAFQGVALGDCFNLHLRYQIENVPTRSRTCNVQVYIGLQWLKSTRQQKRISNDIELKLANHLKEIFATAEEFLLARPLDPPCK
ncbi:putative membrane protein [Nymphaea thermarum]|nr:putative membrane protein [Nymphaea thermarum]